MVVDKPGSTFLPLRTGVFLALIQIGGIGIITLGTYLLVLVGRRLSLQNEFVLINAFGIEDVHGLPSLLHRALLFTLFFEGAGTALLSWRYLEQGVAPRQAVYYGFFHAVSAYCNAGFSLHADSLVSMQTDPVYVLSAAALIIFRGLGFWCSTTSVLKFWRRNRRKAWPITLHTRIVVATTLLLLLGATLLFLVAEWHTA